MHGQLGSRSPDGTIEPMPSGIEQMCPTGMFQHQCWIAGRWLRVAPSQDGHPWVAPSQDSNPEQAVQSDVLPLGNPVLIPEGSWGVDVGARSESQCRARCCW